MAHPAFEGQEGPVLLPTVVRLFVLGAELCLINSEGFLAEVFHPWVRWEGPGSGFENSSGGGAWKSRIHRFGPLGIEVEKQGFRTAWLITGQKFP